MVEHTRLYSTKMTSETVTDS